MRYAIVLPVLALAACASAPAPRDPQFFFADHAFAAPAEPVRRDQVFALSAPMQAYLKNEIAQRVHRLGPRLGLADVLRWELRVEYDTTQTRTAAEAFEARAGNCLSLTLLTAAFAKQLGIPIRYQSVYGQDVWSRQQGIAFLSRHVNLALLQGWSKSPLARDGENDVTIDFLPPDQVRTLHSSEVGEETVVAMYLNNRAAEALARQDVDGAYWWAREALIASPAFVSAYNTLAVLYLRRGEPALAERVLDYAAQREPGNFSVLSNLAQLYVRQNRHAEAQRAQRRLAALAKYPPFHFFDQGMNALAAGDDQAALKLFRKELARMPHDHELHFLTALANLRLGELARARRHLELARDNSTTPERQGLYAAKLRHLQTLHVN